MKRENIKLVPSAWLQKEGRPLDCGPYLSGAIEAKVLLDELPVAKKVLKEVTLGGLGGIFNGPRFPRNYVDSPETGVPFLGSTDILDADLTYLSLLSRKQAARRRELLVEEGWTLITCSGTIGRRRQRKGENPRGTTLSSGQPRRRRSSGCSVRPRDEPSRWTSTRRTPSASSVFRAAARATPSGPSWRWRASTAARALSWFLLTRRHRPGGMG